MGAKRTSATTGEAEQQLQLQHPSPEVIWARAVEVFGAEDVAREWMRTPLAILDQHTPSQYSKSKDKKKQQEVLAILGRIDYGILG